MIRCYVGIIAEPLVDARNNAKVHSASHYLASQVLGTKLRKMEEYGVCYLSVRHNEGVHFGLFRLPVTTPVKQVALKA